MRHLWSPVHSLHDKTSSSQQDVVVSVTRKATFAFPISCGERRDPHHVSATMLDLLLFTLFRAPCTNRSLFGEIRNDVVT